MARCWSAESLRPADAALLDPSRLAGVATEEGGADGHTAVMLRALGVPAVLGAAGVAHAIKPGDIAVVDGATGTVALQSVAGNAGRRAPCRHRLRPRAADAMPGCAGCPPKRWTARRSSCRPIWNCRSSCR